MHKQLTVPATFDTLIALVPFIEAVAAPASPPLRARLQLAVHELCANIVRHGYAGLPGEIELTAERRGTTLIVSIRDQAPNAYVPPDRVAMPDPFALPEGGWGMPIVYQVMDEVHYERLAAGNRWTLARTLTNERETETVMSLPLIAVPERLDASNAAAFRATIHQAIEGGADRLILDLAATTFIDSSGLAALISGLKAIRAREGSIVLVGAQGEAKAVIELTRMDLVFTMYPTVEAARAALQAS